MSDTPFQFSLHDAAQVSKAVQALAVDMGTAVAAEYDAVMRRYGARYYIPGGSLFPPQTSKCVPLMCAVAMQVLSTYRQTGTLHTPDTGELQKLLAPPVRGQKIVVRISGGSRAEFVEAMSKVQQACNVFHATHTARLTLDEPTAAALIASQRVVQCAVGQFIEAKFDIAGFTAPKRPRTAEPPSRPRKRPAPEPVDAEVVTAAVDEYIDAIAANTEAFLIWAIHDSLDPLDPGPLPEVDDVETAIRQCRDALLTRVTLRVTGKPVPEGLPNGVAPLTPAACEPFYEALEQSVRVQATERYRAVVVPERYPHTLSSAIYAIAPTLLAPVLEPFGVAYD